METHIAFSGRARVGRMPERLALVGDERLARLVGGGSGRAFDVLYERYHQQLYRYCRSMLGNDVDAQDALQSAFAGAFAALSRNQRDAPVRPWLFRIAHNESVSLSRRRRPEGEFSQFTEHPTVSVEERVEERERFAQLVADLRELPESQRGALVMRELSGLSHEEIAVALDVTVGAAKQTIFEARRSLMEFVEGRAMVCEDVRRTISDADGRSLRSRRMRAHLRDCSACVAFTAAIPERQLELRALAPPLPGLAAAGIFARVVGGGSGHGGAGAVAAGAGKTVGTALATKALAGAAIVATAAAGATIALKHHAHTAHRPPAVRTTPVTPATGPAHSAPVTAIRQPRGRHAAAGRLRRRHPVGAGAAGIAGGASRAGAAATQRVTPAAVPLRRPTTGGPVAASGAPGSALPSFPSKANGTAQHGRRGSAPGHTGSTPTHHHTGSTPAHHHTGSTPAHHHTGSTPAHHHTGPPSSVPGPVGRTPGAVGQPHRHLPPKAVTPTTHAGSATGYTPAQLRCQHARRCP